MFAPSTFMEGLTGERLELTGLFGEQTKELG
jgi:hypothetical protein